MAKSVDKREKLKQQHAEVCKDFENLMVCPRGARCQRLHRYGDTSDKQIVKMLDFIIGTQYNQNGRLTKVETQLGVLINHYEADQADINQKSKEKEATIFRRISRQVRERSKSSERAKSRGRSPSRHSQQGEQEAQPIQYASQIRSSTPIHQPYQVFNPLQIYPQQYQQPFHVLPQYTQIQPYPPQQGSQQQD